jgi:VanZ family protein
MIASMYHRLVSIAAWISLGYIAFATLSPMSGRPHVAGVHFEHIVAFTVLGLLFFLAYPQRAILVCVIVFGSAALLEVLQLLTPDRHGRLADAVEKIAGGAAGIVVGRSVLFLEQAKRWFRP